MASAPTTLPPLIPREVLFGNPEKANVRLSPDGKYLSYCAPDERDVMQIWVRTVGGKDDRMLTHDEKRGIRSYFWTYLPEQLLYRQDTGGDEDWHLYQVDIRTGQTRDVTPFEKIRADIVAIEPESPGSVLIALNRENVALHDVYRLDLASGRLDLDTKNPGNVLGWAADGRMAVRAAVAANSDGSVGMLLREAYDRPWEEVRQWSPDELGYPVGFSQDGKTLYFAGNHDANALRLLTRDLATGDEHVIAEHPQYDVSEFVVHPVSRTIQAAAFQKERLEWTILDPQIAPDFEVLRKVRAGEVSIASRDLADKIWVVAFARDDGPVHFYLYDRASKSATLLFTSQHELEGLPLVSMQPISYESRDGLTINGYLSLPKGQPAQMLPTVLFIHGGPRARDTWGFNSEVQWLANRGYAVLQINYRGSAGYGKVFMNAGNREWGGKMHDDLVDGVAWIINQGIADPKRVGILGGSYGGYAVLVGLTFTPDLFAVGVDLVGPSNLLTFLSSIPAYWVSAMGLIKHQIGDPDTEPEFLKSRSPLFFVDRIQAPLLIGQGANDPRVKEAESQQIVEAMRKAGKPVEYVLYTDEGHGFARPENQLHFWAIAEEFLAKFLHGRFEPAVEISGHSGTIK